MSSKSYMSAPDADKIAATLLASVHSELAEFPVRCIFQDSADKKGGRIVLANVRKLTGLTAFLAGSVAIEGLQDSLELDLPIAFQSPRELILIVIAFSEWEDLTTAQREALIDHELMHCSITFDDDGVPHVSMRAHSCEEFYEIIHRHGDWKGEIARFKKPANAIQPIQPVELKQVAGGVG